MQTKTITVDYARPRGYDVGYRAENNFTLLALPIPAELEGADSYRVYFESTVGDYLQTEPLTPADGYVTVKITSDVVPEPGNMAAQLVAFADGEIVGYAPMITGSAKVSIPDGTERLSHSLAAEIALNTAARHSHSNKSVLDKFAETDGKPTYDGKALGGGGGAGDFIIKMTVEGDDDGNYTLASCDATIEQIDAAVTAEKRVVVIASDGGIIFELPMLQGAQGVMYSFGTFMNGQIMTSFVEKIDESTSKWQFLITQIEAESVDYSNDALPNVTNVRGALNALVPKSHTHANKDTLDKISVSNGKLQYNGSDVGLKGDKGDPGEKGADGAPGAKGDKGEKGDPGAQGIRGEKGDKGDPFTYSDFTAEQLAALKGEKGDKGDKGDKGEKGDTGEQGLRGEQGIQGIQGEKGDKGDKGDTGAQGVQGIQGEKGDKGDKGDAGADGAAGKSAYQYAQDGGYTGTETEFAEKLASGALIVEITDNNGTSSANKSYLEIRDAIRAGTPVLVDYFGLILPLIAIAGSLFFGTIECNNDDTGVMISTPMIEITENNEVNDVSAVVETLPNPNAVTFTGAVTGSYDGSAAMTVNIPSAVTDDHINSLIDAKLGVIENGSY